MQGCILAEEFEGDPPGSAPAPARSTSTAGETSTGSMRTRQSLSDLIEGRLSSADGRAELVRLATRLIVEEALEEIELGHAGAGVLRARGEARARLPQWRAQRPVEDGGRLRRLFGAADRWPGRAVPFRDRRTSQGTDASAREFGRRAAGARSVGARHRGRLPRRDRATLVVEDGGVGDRRAVRPCTTSSSPTGAHQRVRHRLSVRRRHRRSGAAGRTRAGAGGLGLYG